MAKHAGQAKHDAATAPPPFTDEELANAPWMKIALAQLDKGVHEVWGDKAFEDEFYHALSVNNPHLSLLDWNKIDRKIAAKLADNFGSFLMERSNPDVKSYLKTTGLDSFTKRTTSKKHPGSHEWRMQAWCAAFVNWCLLSAGVKPLNSPTARDWIKFGRPVLDPKRGAIAVFKPSKEWEVQGGTGHVAFFGGYEGHKIWVLGGNQSHGKVTWTREKASMLRGYRWPQDQGTKNRRPEIRGTENRGDFPVTTANLA